MIEINSLPPQRLSFSKKDKEWRKKHLDWADNRLQYDYNLIRKSFNHKKINYDLLNGKLNLQDLALIVNPDHIDAKFVPDNIQHYPIINSKLNVLRGEEFNRGFDFRVVVTNPLAITDKETRKKEELFKELQQLIQDSSLTEEEFNTRLEALNDYYSYEYQDLKEIRANELLNHYMKEYSIPVLFNNGFMDAMTVGEEIYQCDIVSGEPIIEKIDPLKIKVYMNGFSNKVEDAGLIILEDYWSISRILDVYHDDLTEKDIKNLEHIYDSGFTDESGNYDERRSFIDISDEPFGSGEIIDGYDGFAGSSVSPYYDDVGNIRVLKVYWKSQRKVKKVTYFDPETGEEKEDLFPEDYIIDEAAGEKEKFIYIDEAWEGTKIGKNVYTRMRPRVVQYNRISNPSRCHFGIVGSIYNLNSQKPFSLVDMMKPYNYLYDCIHDRLNKVIASSWGRLLEVDFASIPTGWTMDKWMYFAKTNKILIKDSFKEGNVGAANGRLAGAFSSNSRGAVDADNSHYIQQYVGLLEFIKNEMSEAVGITKQREGQISNRETVGGVERSTLQSTHITEWLYMIHDDVKKRSLEVFLETAKIAIKGKSLKFQNILSDHSIKLIDIDGDEFAEADYGLVIDGSSNTKELKQKLDQLAHAALQNQTLSFSTIMKIYTSSSLSQTQRMIEKDEQNMIARQQQQREADRETQLTISNNQLQQQLAKLDLEERMNIRDNETNILIAEIKKGEDNTDQDIQEKIRQFDRKMELEKDKMDLQKKEHKDLMNIKEKELLIKNKK